MTTKPDGGPAFPLPLALDSEGNPYQSDQWEGGAGMSLRDYAAIKFMAAMLGLQDDRGTHMAPPPKSAAEQALAYADAFIAARDE